MRSSKLELYEDVICTLAKTALTIDGIAFECNMNCVTLEQRLDFLVKHDIVSIEVSRDNLAFYVLTRRGLAIAKTLAITKRLEKMQTNSEPEDESLQAIAAMSERDEEKANRAW